MPDRRPTVSILLLAACAASEPVALPPPTGDLPIGRTTLRWTDGQRPEVMTEADDDRREVIAHLWYPAAPPAEDVAAPYVVDLDALRTALDGRTRRALSLVEIHAVSDAPVRDDDDAFPLLLLSPGNDMLSAQFSFLAEELVSHGFVVVALEHPFDARAVVLEDGRVVAYDQETWPPLPPVDDSGRPDADSAYLRFYRERVETRAGDARFVLDELAVGAVDGAAAEVAARLDLDRVGFLGHSVGGVAAGAVCQMDVRFGACLNLDGDSGAGPFTLRDDGSAFNAPYMMLTKPFAVTDAQLASWNLTRDAWEATLQAERDRFFGAVRGGAFRVVLDGATHQSFSDDPYVFARLQGDPEAAEHEARMEVVRAYTLAFFERSLLGEPAPLLEDGAEPPEGVTVEAWAADG
jgi:hypothetical protein